MTPQQILEKFKSKKPSFPHEIELEMWPHQPVFRSVESVEQWFGEAMTTLVRIINAVGDFKPQIVFETEEGSNKTKISVMPPRDILEESNQLN